MSRSPYQDSVTAPLGREYDDDIPDKAELLQQSKGRKEKRKERRKKKHPKKTKEKTNNPQKKKHFKWDMQAWQLRLGRTGG